MAKGGEQKRESGARKREDEKKGIALLVFIAVIIFAIAGAIAYALTSQASQTGIETFESNFDSAPTVGVIVTGYNGTTLSATVGCAANLIEQLVATHGSAHRNSSTISLYVINQTSCYYTPNGLGQTSGNYSSATPGECLNMTAKEPRIFINYSASNTTSITPRNLYISGNLKYLAECGVASEITSG